MESAYTYEGTYDINVLIAGRALTGVSAIKSGEAVKNSYLQREKLSQKSKL
jgi:acyl-CoA oxidase